MGRYCTYPVDVPDDLHIHRSQEQLSPRKHTYSEASTAKLFLHAADVGFSYIVLVAGFYYAPTSDLDFDQDHGELLPEGAQVISLSFWESMKWHITSWW